MFQKDLRPNTATIAAATSAGRSHSSGEWAVTPEPKRLHTMARDSLARSNSSPRRR
jgi:hypothetical protein